MFRVLQHILQRILFGYSKYDVTFLGETVIEHVFQMMLDFYLHEPLETVRFDPYLEGEWVNIKEKILVGLYAGMITGEQRYSHQCLFKRVKKIMQGIVERQVPAIDRFAFSYNHLKNDEYNVTSVRLREKYFKQGWNLFTQHREKFWL